MNSDQSDIPGLTPVEVNDRLHSDHGLILDVREPEELQQVSIPDVMHVPLNEVPRRISEIPRDRDVFVLCHVGQRSAMATEFLRAQGHERVWNIRGGIIGWLRAGLPATWPRSN